MISFLLKLSIATYLLIGAPQLVNWQMAVTQEANTNPELTKIRFGVVHFLILIVGFAIALGIAIGGITFTLLPGKHQSDQADELNFWVVLGSAPPVLAR